MNSVVGKVWKSSIRVEKRYPRSRSGAHESRKFNHFGPFSDSSPIYNGGWQMTTDSKIRGHYPKFNRSDFWNSSSFFVTWPLNSGPNHVWQVIFLRLCDLYQTWYTGSTRWQMHNGMTLTRIHGQGHRDPNALAKVDRQSLYGANFLYCW